VRRRRGSGRGRAGGGREKRKNSVGGESWETKNRSVLVVFSSLYRRRRRLINSSSSCRIILPFVQSLTRLQDELSDLQTRLTSKDRDLQALHEGSRQLGDTHANDRFALELEIASVKRDLEFAEEELRRTKRELDRSEEKLKGREEALSELHVASRDLEAKLSAERQARLNVSDKLDSVQKVCSSFRSVPFTISSNLITTALLTHLVYSVTLRWTNRFGFSRSTRSPNPRPPPSANASTTSNSA
jgi:chromosome segregation ATPase